MWLGLVKFCHFGKKFQNLWQTIEGFSIVWQNFESTFAKILPVWASFNFYKWPKIILPSGHTWQLFIASTDFFTTEWELQFGMLNDQVRWQQQHQQQHHQEKQQRQQLQQPQLRWNVVQSSVCVSVQRFLQPVKSILKIECEDSSTNSSSANIWQFGQIMNESFCSSQFIGMKPSDDKSPEVVNCYTSPSPIHIFLKMGHPRALFLYFRLFKTQLTVNICSI